MDFTYSSIRISLSDWLYGTKLWVEIDMTLSLDDVGVAFATHRERYSVRKYCIHAGGMDKFH
jgi:hypothetical protein